MKKIILAIAALTALTLASCGGSAVRSPEIIFNSILVNSVTPESDTIYVGDTLQLYMILQPYYDKLTYFKVEVDHSYFTDSLFNDADFEKFCNQSSSKRSESYYVFNDLGNANALYLAPGKLIAKKSPDTESREVPIKFYLKSTADVKDEYNPFYQKLTIKILPNKATP